jgi:hypothetical protein
VRGQWADREKWDGASVGCVGKEKGGGMLGQASRLQRKWPKPDLLYKNSFLFCKHFPIWKLFSIQIKFKF